MVGIVEEIVPQLDDSRAVRAMFGRFASGVTVITCGDIVNAHGMTANSFTSVSLEPAMGLVSVAKLSRMHQRLSDAELFAISVLPDSAQPASDHFAGRSNGYQPDFVEQHGVAVLRNAIAWMVLEQAASFDVATHTLFVGRIKGCGYTPDVNPLIYFGGAYQALARHPMTK